MIKEAIGVGETEEEALQNACDLLGKDTVDVEFEVLQRPEKKVMGLFGGSKAKVRAWIQDEPSDIAESYLKNILKLMGLGELTVKRTDEAERTVFDISGEDVGTLIGKRGETLDAVQYLTSLSSNHSDGAYVRVVLNVGEFREKREKTLETLGRSLAIKTARTGRRNKLEAMNPYERRIIHTAVQEIKGAISWSEGEGINRHVVIGPDPEYKGNRSYGGGYGNRSSYGDRGGRRPYDNNRSSGGYGNRNGRSYDSNRSSSYSESGEKSEQRKPLNESVEGRTYGRIDK